MKTSPFFLLALGATLLTVPLTATHGGDTTPAPSAPATESTSPATPSGGQGERGERLKSALAQLNLSDDQKAKIKDIFTNVTDRKERRQQIAAVLTPEQKEKLKQMIQERRANGAETPTAN